MPTPSTDSTSDEGAVPRGRDEEHLVRLALPAMSRVPGVLVLRNEANALTSFLVGIRRVLRAYPDLLRACEVEYRKIPGAIRYGLGIGSADVVACARGEFVGVEFKAPRGAVSEEQETWGEAVERAGGRYVPVRSVEEAVRAVGGGGE